MKGILLKALDPMRVVAWHRTFSFKANCTVGVGFSATERSNIFVHGAPRKSIEIGDYACIDGTIEVYRQGQLKIGRHFFLGRSRIYCAHGVNIGDYVLISDAVSIMDSNLHSKDSKKRRAVAEAWTAGRFPDVYEDVPGDEVSIGDDVWIGYGACVLKGVTIGQGAIVGAGSVVTANVDPWTVVSGVPAKKIMDVTGHDHT